MNLIWDASLPWLHFIRLVRPTENEGMVFLDLLLKLDVTEPYHIVRSTIAVLVPDNISHSQCRCIVSYDQPRIYASPEHNHTLK
jgi:hypothetical protein